MQVVYRPIASLIPYAKNARTHSDAQVAQIAASIAEFGWTNPILVDGENGVIAGHGRLLAARQLGLAEVPVIELAHLTPNQRRAYIIADNQLAMQAGWNEELLGLELADLKAADYDLSLIGFDEDELDRLLGEAEDTHGGLTDDDATPELQEAAVSCLGDLWLLGDHRLLCGDATNADDVIRLLGGERPHLMVTDPPYGVEYNPGWRHDAGVNNTQRLGQVRNDDRADWREAWALFPGDVAYIWHAALYASTVQASLEACDFNIRSQIVWVKSRFVLSRGHYHWGHEACWYAVRDGATGHWNGARDQSTVWQITYGTDEEDPATTHGTQKPVEAMLRPVVNNSSPGQLVYEPFSGSGTTIIACEKSSRRARAIELDPRYVDLAVRRWQDYTGQSATRESDGTTFDALSASNEVA